jgi:hypothetical protein
MEVGLLSFREGKKMNIKQVFNKKLLGPVTILHLLVLCLVATALGSVLLYYDWTINLTAATPDIRFYKWSDGTQANTIDLSYNIYADVWMIDYNTTYGIKNNAVSDKTVYLWWDSCSDPESIANFTVQIIDETGFPLLTYSTIDFSTYSEFLYYWTAGAGGIDTIKVMIKGASTVSSVSIGLRLKTDA